MNGDGSGPPARPPLGQLLLERGLLTEEQLDAALEEHVRRGQPVGKVIVDMGLLPAALVAKALATQHGGSLETEYGVATGLTVEPLAESGPNGGRPASHEPPAGPPGDEARAPGDRFSRLEAERNTAVQELEAARAERERALAAAEVAERRAEAKETALASALQELATARARAFELERQVAGPTAPAAGEELRERLAALEERVAAALEPAPAVAESVPPPSPPSTAQPEAGPPRPEPAAEATPAPAEDGSHLAFVSGPEGYRLLELPGPAPQAGSVVELPPETGAAGRHLVVRTGRANLPGRRAACAYLLPAD